MIFILDRQEKVIGLLKNGGGNSSTPPFYDDLLVEDLATGAETFQFTTIMNDDTSSDLCVGNYVAFRKDGKTKLFQIVQTSEDHGETLEMVVYAESAGLGLINHVVRKQKLISSTLRRFMTTVLDDTGWTLGKCPTVDESYDIEIEDGSAYAIIQNNIAQYGVELEFRVELQQGRISNKYVDLHETRGNVTGKRFEFGRDVEGISRKTDSTELFTALIGKGKDGIDFRDVTVSGIDKPKGQDFVAIQSAYDRYNVNGYHIMGVFEYDTDSPEELLRQTYKKLKECVDPKVEYEVSVAMLGKLLGQEWNEVAIGDTVYIVDNYFNPPIHLAARVNVLETSMTDPQSDKCVLANFIEVKSNITDEMRKIAAKLEGYVDSSVNDKFPVTSDNIANGAITQDKIVEYSIETKHLKADSITAEKIKADEIQAKHISANQIETKHLQANAIDADKIQANAITAEKIKASEITADHLQANTITADKIATGTITAESGVIQNGTITNALIAEGAIDSANIKEAAIGTAHIIDGAIDSAKIGTAAIGSAHIQEASIDSAKISSLSADKIEGGQIDAKVLTANVIEAINASIGTIDAKHIDVDSIKVDSIDAENIKGQKIDTNILSANIIEAINGSFEELTIDNAKIGTIDAEKIIGTQIDAKILSANVISAINASIGVINADRIDAKSIKVDEILSERIESDLVDTDKLSANIITAINAYLGEVKIKQGAIETLVVGDANILDATINGAKITQGTITNAEIKDATIEAAKIKDVYASQIKSGTVETGELEINSIDGSLSIKGNTIQIKDNQPDPKVRVQIGQDSRNEYGILVCNSEGKAIFDSDKGVLIPEGLSDGVVSEEKIKDEAIGPTKLNLDELFVKDSAFIQKLSATEIDAGQISTGVISNERIDIKGLVSFEAFDESTKDLLFPVYSIDEDGKKVYNKTYINGGNIYTGTIKADSIDLLSGINVRDESSGLTTFSVSSEGQVEVNGLLKSGNYDEHAETGYKLSSDGNATLNQATIRGSVILPNAGITNGRSSNRKPMFTFVDDDGRWTTKEMIKGWFDSRGIKGCAAVVSDTFDYPSDWGYMTVEQMKELEADGWDILCHSNNFDTITTDSYYWNFQESKAAMEKHEFKAGNIFVYPNGNVGDDAEEIQRVCGDYFDYAMNVTGLTNVDPFDDMNISRVVLDRRNGLNSPTVQGAIKETMDNNGWCVFYFHSYMYEDTGENGFDLDSLLEIVDYIKTTGAEIVTATEAIRTIEGYRGIEKYKDIRFWAGSTYERRGDAPFRVYDNGDIYATNAKLSGTLYGDIDSGLIHIRDDSFTLNKVQTFMDNDGIVRSVAPMSGKNDTYITLNTSYSQFNNDVIFGTTDYSSMRYSKEDQYVQFSNVDFSVEGGTTKLSVEKDDEFINGVNFAARKDWNDGNLTMGYAGGSEAANSDWKNTFLFTSKGSKGKEYGDICFRRELDTEDIDVRVQGNLEIKNRIKGSNHDIEMRCVKAEGWGFYVS